MENPNFYTPTQILFHEKRKGVCAGIAFKDYVICACCGDIFNLDEVKILKTLKWVDFTEYIR